MSNLESTYILNTKINTGLTMETVLSLIENEFLTDKRSHYICTTNPEFIMLAQEDNEFREIINNSDLSIPDGAGVVQAIKYIESTTKYERNALYPLRCFLTGLKIGLESINNTRYLTHKIRGVDLTHEICRLSAEKGYTIFLLGGRIKDKRGNWVNNGIDIAQVAAHNLQKRYPGIQIVGASSQFNRAEHDDAATVDYIHQCMKEKYKQHLDFIFVAYEQSYQEKWIVRNMGKIPVKTAIGVGSTIDYMSGLMKYSPNVFNRMNIEWLYKLITQPWRFKRIINAFPNFPVKVFLSSFK